MVIVAHRAGVRRPAACRCTQATLPGKAHDLPVCAIATTAVRCPDLAMCQARYLPPSPLPRMSISKCSGWDIFNSSSFESERHADEHLDPPQQVVRRNAVFKAKLVE